MTSIMTGQHVTLGGMFNNVVYLMFYALEIYWIVCVSNKVVNALLFPSGDIDKRLQKSVSYGDHFFLLFV